MRSDITGPDVMTYSESVAYYAAQAEAQSLTTRQTRNQGMNALPSWPTICSVEHDEAERQAEAAHAANAQDPLLNGDDALRRLHSHG
jgi:hypothetical protein